MVAEAKRVGIVKALFLETRPQFLLLDPVCVFAGVAVSLYEGVAFNALYFVLAFIGVICSHISVNVLNDYFDYKSGIDLKTHRTPFSGGSGFLPAAKLTPKDVFIFGMVNLGITILIGIYFIVVYQWAMLPVGLIGIAMILLYTPVLTKVPVVTELLGPGLGCSMWVLGTYVAQTGHYSGAAIAATVVAGLLIANLLLLNEFPDVEADKVGGRRHLPILVGPKVAAWAYCLIGIAAYVAIILAVVTKVLPPFALFGLLTLPIGIKAMVGAIKFNSDIPKLVPVLGMNVMTVLLTPLLMSIGIVIWTYTLK
jgi:1,4-dihydroxy-2-naphthoate octaprenyltransferase